MDNIMQFVPVELLILLICTPIVGELLKVSPYTENIIPLALFVFDIVFSVLLLRSFSATTILQGIIVWGIAIGGYDTVKALKKRGK